MAADTEVVLYANKANQVGTFLTISQIDGFLDSIYGSVIPEVMEARRHQLEKWGYQKNSAAAQVLIFSEEWGEYVKALNDGDIDAQKHELAQAIACLLPLMEELLKVYPKT